MQSSLELCESLRQSLIAANWMVELAQAEGCPQALVFMRSALRSARRDVEELEQRIRSGEAQPG